MEIENFLEEQGERIEKEVESNLERYREEAKEYHGFIGDCYNTLEEFILRKGKRIASTTTLLTYQGYTGETGDDILSVCSGIELYRHAILIHDDLIDLDVRRRGGETLHEIYSEEHGERFGEGLAVFLGNIVFNLAEKTIRDSKFPEKKREEVLSLISEQYKEVNESQILDLLFEHKDVSPEEWRVMASKRAASLFKTTLHSGAILGGAPERDMETLEKVTENIGYSFDIQDDIIDTFADEKQYGRKPCRDIRLGKKPLHIAEALQSENEEDSEELKSFLKRENLNRDEIERIRKLIRKTGGLKRVKETSRKHADKAKELIRNTELDDRTKSLFKSLIDFVQESLDWYK